MLALAALAAFLGSAAEAAAFNWLALSPWRRSTAQHWTERARLLYPARRSLSRNLIFFPVALALAAVALNQDTSTLAVFFIAFLGAVLGCYPVNRELFPELGFWRWLHRIAGGWLVFFAIWLAYMLCVVLMPFHYGLGTWLDIALFFAFAALFLRGFNLRLLRLLRLLRPVTPHLQNLVDQIAAKMRQPVRAVWISSSTTANAWAFPVSGELVFTSTLLARLSDDEIQAICAHELGHLGESRWVLLGRIVISLAVFPLIFAFPVMDQFGAFAPLALLAAAFLILRLGVPLRRRMEKRADRVAAGFTPDPAIYARALERVYEANRTPAVMPRRSAKIHPNLYDRMTAAGVTPDFPKPLPPNRYQWTDLLLLLFLVLALILAAPVLASQ